ncbi:hypothetical protein M9H77_02900 [Catharanthus roseus]|uniref:ARR type transcription factor n=2 Tax=Catharanthus roseus TaxID=4058 RepID=Q71BZ2_CATRO|nr:type-A response regulator [Catharanthus roseus]KAI5681672.1 hypothetical protein M9H77_02900 [Catharanthus roseus]QTJ02277.1 ARR type transcription factor [Catharanthus roseus]
MAAQVLDVGFHVLAVDDSLVDRKLIERLLKTSAYQVTVVDSGIKALEFLGLLDEEKEISGSNHQQVVEVNLIITDYSMPGMTGYDLLRKVKESSYLKDIPVVIMSSENIPSRINRCLEEGADDFFLKPVKQSDVNKLIPLVPNSFTGKPIKNHEQQQIFSSSTCKRKQHTDEYLSPTLRRKRYNQIFS